MKQYQNSSLKNLHTFHTEVSAKKVTIFQTEEEAVEYFKQNSKCTKRLVIGEGSNLLFVKDFEGELLKIENKGFEIIETRAQWVWVKAAAGENWDDFVAWAVKNGFGGVENLSYIPGTVGASPVQNIGAYGVEVQNVFNSLEAIDLNNGHRVNFYLHELEFDYRYSIFKGPLKNKFLVTSVVFKLDRYPKVKLDYGNLREEALKTSNKSYADIKNVRQAVINIRKSKLPEHNEIGNAGSFFKNPIICNKEFDSIKALYPNIAHYPLENEQTKIAAAWLIENAGLKGYTIGDAGVHPNHALIIINKDKATGIEIAELSNHIQKTVFTKFKVQLEPEVIIL
ncbi:MULTISPECIES: UDP-N-acetylmuramate dehydrogenase [unclassified Lentimicrobium]|uniref:UDP-N-acetylmuramate dehydrogenase n=1 Tax=unclassified Lentimicrobium TaxID=2677434 RepID=UPI001554A1E8|nr:MULTISPECIES: UDP-N-acetylmuramate dehydrogenase [unclassified Lentimicrobium]NPD46468.1 UDP-N-acetylmuramate dehydrogenase [Lentimicrobium sp. S6]NPD85974.1 UDP-N-acetylmuramate dehydrogenase [Lentimicrobium sp. L6]